MGVLSGPTCLTDRFKGLKSGGVFMNGGPHLVAVTRQVADDLVLLKELELLLLGAAPLDQLSYCPQAKGPVRQGDLTSLLDACAVVAVGQMNQALQYPDAGYAALQHHRRCPSLAVLPDQAHLTQKMLGSL